MVELCCIDNMNNKFRNNLKLRIAKLLNVLLLTCVFALCWFLYYNHGIKDPFYFKGRLLLFSLYFGLYIIFGRVYDGFAINISSISDIIFSQFLAIGLTDFMMYIIICLLSAKIVNIVPGIICLLVQTLVISLWAYITHRWYYKFNEAVLTAIVYQDDDSLGSLVDSYGLSKRFNIVKKVNISECKNNLSILDDVKAIFISDVHSSERNIVLKYCVEKDIEVYAIPRVSDVILHGAHQIHLFHLPIYKVNRYMPQAEYLIIKRLLDIVVSLLLLIITLPITLITAICIKCYDGGPIFYKQVRLTKDAKQFNILKFRSMRPDAEKDGVARLSSGAKDDRVTPIGKVIRKYRIDELPQLLNILVGDLTLVGPRAERPEIAKEYCKTFPEFNLRLQAKAGLTGLAQVYGKYNTSPYNKLKLDLMYISNPSIIDDFRIVLATIKIIFIPESTEGVSENQTTALDNDE